MSSFTYLKKKKTAKNTKYSYLTCLNIAKLDEMAQSYQIKNSNMWLGQIFITKMSQDTKSMFIQIYFL